jgi:hypothetical protein
VRSAGAAHGLGRSQRARPACAALAQLGLGRAARVAHGARRRCSATGDDSTPAHGDDGEAAAHRHSVMATGGRGKATALARQLSAARARRGRAAGAARRRSWARSAGRCRDAALSLQRFKPRYRRGAWRPRGSGALPRGPGAARDG